jgi:hypothetical protein
MQPLNSRGLSANTLFHFTSSLDNLLNILTNKFHPNFCLEGPQRLVQRTERVGQKVPPNISPRHRSTYRSFVPYLTLTG